MNEYNDNEYKDYNELQKILKEKQEQIANIKEESRLDNLYYRTPAKPYLCCGYKTVSTYNKCSFDEVRKMALPTRLDGKPTAKPGSTPMVINPMSAADYQTVLYLSEYPEKINELVSSNANEQIKFLSKYPILIPFYAKKFPKLAANYSNYINSKTN
jgi:hypothetical protein